MELYKHQKELVDKAPDKHLLAWEVGTGKTYGALSLLKHKALVVVPKSLKEQWEKEDFDIDVITKETFRRDHKKVDIYEALILDEAHYFSGMQGFRKKSAMLKSALWYINKHQPEQIYLLTGTPYLSTPYNIYALAEILGHTWEFKKFKETFFSMVNMGRRFPVPILKKDVDWIGTKIKTEDAVARLVSNIGNTVRMDECVDVPEQIYQIEHFDLTVEQKKAIEALTDIVPIVRWTKTHQICGGTLKSDGYVPDAEFKSEKMKRIVELAQEHKKLIIICRYNYEIRCIEQKILDKYKNKQTIIINGATKDKHILIKEAEDSKEVIIIINAACSEGYELPSFPIMVFYSHSFSLKDYIQIKGRIQRIDKIKRNVYLSLIVKGTIDEDVKISLDKKTNFDLEIYDKGRSKIS